MKKLNILLTLLVFVFSTNAMAGLLFTYSQLTVKDLDQMAKIVNDKIAESKKSAHGKEVPLKEALQAVYARPNDDDMINKVVAPLRTNLDDLGSWEKTISQLTDEAINALKNPKAFQPVVQVTYVVFLENLLSELKPYIATEGFERSMTERIQNAKITVTKEAISERKLRMMKGTASPSETAEKILKAAGEAKPESSHEDKESPEASE
ncbi:hypothetical protein BDW_02695 [Bdellovibrio bacteriovorus W]|nr:hypothetical protein BDW_02695 [Bdellovibrio bacteriovorus W]